MGQSLIPSPMDSVKCSHTSVVAVLVVLILDGLSDWFYECLVV